MKDILKLLENKDIRELEEMQKEINTFVNKQKIASNNCNWVEELILKHESWEDLVKGQMIERLEDHKNESVYLSELAFDLFQNENFSGSFTFSTYYSKELIKKYFDDFNILYQNLLFESDEDNAINIFDEAEKFIVIMLIEQAREIMWEVERHFDTDEIELTDENIKKIIHILECEI